MTKEERREYMREYAAKNKEAHAKYARSYYMRNRDKIRKKSLEYYYEHHEEGKAYRRRYREEHLDYFHEYDRDPATKARRKELRDLNETERKKYMSRLYKMLEEKKQQNTKLCSK